MQPKVTIYTDGSCLGNPGPGGWACVLLCDGREIRLKGGEPQTTNNRMELLGAINGLQRLGDMSCVVTIISDSQYLVNAFNKGWLAGWKRNGWQRADGELKNSELWQMLDRYLAKHTCTFQWVKGHGGDKYNEICDKLAVEMSRHYSKPDTAAYPNVPYSASTVPVPDREGEACGSIETVMAALQASILAYHNLRDGFEYPCGLYSYCSFCKDVPNRCAAAYMSERSS